MSIKKWSATSKNIAIMIFLLLLTIAVYYLHSIIAPFLVALVIAYIMNPIVKFFEKRKFKRNWSVVIVFVLCFLLFITFVVPFTVNMIVQAKDIGVKLRDFTKAQFSSQYAAARERLKSQLNEHFPEYRETLDNFIKDSKFLDYVSDGFVKTKDGLVTVSGKAFDIIGDTFAGMFNLFFIPMLVFYILLDLDNLFEGFKKLIPPTYRPRTISILEKIDKHLSAMLRGQCVENLIFAVMMSIGLWLSGLHSFLFLGLLAGIANFIPYLGGFFTCIIAAFVAITQFGFGGALGVAAIKITIAVAIIQFIDCWYMQPYIVGENAGLHPLTIMLALTIAGSLAGIVGMLLAVPVTIIIKVIGLELYNDLYDQEFEDVQPD